MRSDDFKALRNSCFTYLPFRNIRPIYSVQQHLFGRSCEEKNFQISSLTVATIRNFGETFSQVKLRGLMKHENMYMERQSMNDRRYAGSVVDG